MRYSLAFIVLVSATFLYAQPSDKKGEPTQNRTQTFDSVSSWNEVVTPCLNVISAVPVDARVLTNEQVAAIRTLGLYRADAACPGLLRIITAKASIPHKTKRPPLIQRKLNDFPAAAALAEIGMPSVRAIVASLASAGAEIDPLSAVLYAEVIESVLGSNHAIAYLERERSDALPHFHGRFTVILNVYRKRAMAAPEEKA